MQVENDEAMLLRGLGEGGISPLGLLANSGRAAGLRRKGQCGAYGNQRLQSR
jgi:hypothetical protein